MLTFVRPDVIRIELADGAFIDVKRELNAGERRGVFADMCVGGVMRQGEPAELDPRKVGLTRMLAYLVGWSALDEDGRPVPLSLAALDNLSYESFNEIANAIDAHEERVERERAEKKRIRSGEPGLRVISG